MNESIIEGAPPAVGETVVLRLAALAPRVMTAKVTKVEPVTGVGPVSHEVEIVEVT